MSLELVIGPMFAGKSSYILSVIRRYEAIGYPVLTVTTEKDKRYDASGAYIHSHNHEKHPAFAVLTLGELYNYKELETVKLVVIEEAQFFSDLIPFVRKMVEERGKDVLVVGLDGDAERRPFGSLLSLVPFCDKITKLNALCKLCGDLTPAPFTNRKIKSEQQVMIGTEELYEALCRKHWLAKNASSS
jgi:thymidine kinase